MGNNIYFCSFAYFEAIEPGKDCHTGVGRWYT